MDDSQIVDTWIRFSRKEKHSEKDPDFAAASLFIELVSEDPERLYALIGKIIQKTGEEKLLALLGAGPIEDLLCYHGAAYVDRILDNARRDVRWRFALGCVWIDRTDNQAVKERVEAAILTYFPDGTP